MAQLLVHASHRHSGCGFDSRQGRRDIFLVFEFDERPLPPTQAHDENSLKFVHYQLNVNLLYTSIKLIIEE